MQSKHDEMIEKIIGLTKQSEEILEELTKKRFSMFLDYFFF